MPGYEAKFVHPLLKRHECPICLFAMRNPVQTECGHLFCKECLSPVLRRRRPICPLDQEAITQDGVSQLLLCTLQSVDYWKQLTQCRTITSSRIYGLQEKHQCTVWYIKKHVKSMQTTYEGRDDIKVKICIQSRSHLRTFFHTRVQRGVKRCRNGLCIRNKQVPFLHLFHTRNQNRQVCRPTTRAEYLSTVQRWVRYISVSHALHQSCHISNSGYRCTVTYTLSQLGHQALKTYILLSPDNTSSSH